MKLRLSNWKKYLFEFLSIFIAVVAAFALNNWNDNRRDRISETKILTEIRNGLKLDLEDIQGNMMGHRFGLRACTIFRDLIDDQPVSQDSLAFFYTVLVRDFTSIMNRTGYESLKSKGLEIIENDTLRFQIISLYDYNYQIMYKLEEVAPEMQAFLSFYDEINQVISPYLRFNDQGRMIGVSQPMNLNAQAKNAVLSALWRIENNRRFKLIRYQQTIEAVRRLIGNIEKELN
jgi:hypothetical protein